MPSWYYYPLGSNNSEEFGPFRTKKAAHEDADNRKFKMICVRRAIETCDKFVSINKVNYRCVLDQGHTGRHMTRRGIIGSVDTIEWE
jgi:hypothetical protein